MASIGSQFASEMGGLVANTAREAVKATTDVVTGVVETLATGGGTTQTVQAGTQGSSEKMSNNAQDPRAQAQKRQMDQKRRFNQVKQELEEYRQRQGQVKQQEEQQEKKEEAEKVQFKQSEKARKEQEYLAQIKRSYSGANEGAKQKG